MYKKHIFKNYLCISKLGILLLNFVKVLLYDNVFNMSDQLLIIDKYRRWFWYFGVLPLIASYLICLNFIAEFLSIVVIEKPSITLSYMASLLFFITIGLALLMILWCLINTIRVFKISFKINLPEFKIKKYIFNASVIFFPIIAFVGFIPLSIIIYEIELYLPLFPIIEPVAQDLTPYLFPVYSFIVNTIRGLWGQPILSADYFTM